MTDAADDFEALFDEVSAQRPPTVATAVTADPTAEKVSGESAVPEPAAEQVPPEPNAAASETYSPHKAGMYQRLGGIARTVHDSLHDSLRELGYDRSISDVTNKINDAQGRLEHIAMLTEQAANKVLNTVDTALPEQDKLGAQAKEIEARWEQLLAGKLNVEEFKALAGDSRQFSSMVVQATDVEKARLLDIMMAQDFQDITGQLIKKIITITNMVERELAQLLLDNAPPEVRATLTTAEQQQAELKSGPSSPGTALVQDDVDSLLADLGF